MLKLGSLKFCFAASLLVHAVIFGVVKWAGDDRHPAALQHERELMTLQLVAAPEAPPEAVVAPVAPPSVPAPPEPAPVTPPPPPVAEPPSPVVEETEVAPMLTEPVPVPEPVPAEPPPSLPASIPVAKVEPRVPPASAAVRGDGSSVQTGQDAMTSKMQPGVLARPNYLKNPEPVYPLQARRRQQQGIVLLEVRVSGEGRAAEVSIKETSGYAILDEAAMNAVRDWEFEPARVGTTPVESRIEVPVRFRLAR